MRTVVFVSCVKTKSALAAPAAQLFANSALFRLSYAYAKTLAPDVILFLTTEYGLVKPDEVIEPYDTSPYTMSATQWRNWSMRVMERLRTLADPDADRFIFLTGKNYSDALEPYLQKCETPLAHLTRGRRLHFFKEALSRP